MVALQIGAHGRNVGARLARIDVGEHGVDTSLRGRRDFHLIVDSVLKSSVVNELVHRCDVVFHLAAAVGVRLIVEQPVHTLVISGTVWRWARTQSICAGARRTRRS